jgi:hypothetical protein
METASVYSTGQDVEGRALAIPAEAQALVVTDNKSMARAHTMLADIRALRKEIQDTFRPLAEKAHQAHKAIVQKQKEAEAPLIEAENYLKPAILAYMDSQERVRREKEARLREEARAAEEERRLAEAVLAEQEGSHVEAEEILNGDPGFVPAPVLPRTTPKVDMRLLRRTWKVRVVNLRALVEAAAQNEFLLPYLMANEPALNQMARAQKGMMKIPGVEVIFE